MHGADPRVDQVIVTLSVIAKQCMKPVVNAIVTLCTQLRGTPTSVKAYVFFCSSYIPWRLMYCTPVVVLISLLHMYWHVFGYIGYYMSRLR